MAQNRSHAVMAQRREAPDSLDHFPTPPWATRALLEYAIHCHGWRLDQVADMTVWEPACAEGYMARVLAEYFATVHASDVFDYGHGYPVFDFLSLGDPLGHAKPPCRRPDWIITNPPFRLAVPFIMLARQLARQGVAMLARTVFIEGAERYRELFKPHPPLIFAPFCERVPMLKGRLDRKASSATSYAWFVWPGRDSTLTRLNQAVVWIPPCRTRLERPGDYDLPEAA